MKQCKIGCYSNCHCPDKSNGTHTIKLRGVTKLGDRAANVFKDRPFVLAHIYVYVSLFPWVCANSNFSTKEQIQITTSDLLAVINTRT